MERKRSNWLVRRTQENGRSKQARVADPDVQASWPAPEVIAGAIRSGDILDVYASHVLTDFMKQPAAIGIDSMAKQLTYGTMCSGSDICHEALAAVTQAMAALGRFDVGIFRQEWACESDVRKRNFLLDLHNRNICVFEDVRAMSKTVDGCARCATHGSYCKIAKTDCLLVGFSCKDQF